MEGLAAFLLFFFTYGPLIFFLVVSLVVAIFAYALYRAKRRALGLDPRPSVFERLSDRISRM